MSKAIRITIDVPPTFHKMLKVYTSSIGKSIKDVFINSINKEIQERLNVAPKEDLSKYSAEEFNNLMNRTVQHIENNNYTEEEEDKMLAPYLIEMVKRIEKDEEKVKA